MFSGHAGYSHSDTGFSRRIGDANGCSIPLAVAAIGHLVTGMRLAYSLRRDRHPPRNGARKTQIKHPPPGETV